MQAGTDASPKAFPPAIDRRGPDSAAAPAEAMAADTPDRQRRPYVARFLLDKAERRGAVPWGSHDRGARLVRHQRSIRIVVARDEEGYWIARGHSEAADEELAQAAADDLAEVAEAHFITVDLPGTSAGGNGLGQ